MWVRWHGPICIFFFKAGLTVDTKISGCPFFSVWLAPAQVGEQIDNEKKGQRAGDLSVRLKILDTNVQVVLINPL